MSTTAVELRAHALAELFQLIAVGLIELGAGNGLARDRGQLRLLAHEAFIALYADQEKGRHDQKQQNELHPATMAANKFEHGIPVAALRK